jgi:hypothetical protein
MPVKLGVGGNNNNNIRGRIVGCDCRSHYTFKTVAA